MPNSGGTEVSSLPDKSRRTRFRRRAIAGGMAVRLLWLRYRVVRYVNPKRLGARFLSRMPPISSVVHVDSVFLDAEGRGDGRTGAAVAERWSGAGSSLPESPSDFEGEMTLPPFVGTFSGSDNLALGFVIGMADLEEFRVAIADARARWCGELDCRQS